MRHRQILTCLFLLLFIPLSAKALPPPSPAGGNYLALDGVDDYAVLDFETFGLLLPDGTDEFTIEAWIYPTTPTHKKNTALTILSQQVRMLIVSDEFPGLNGLIQLRGIDPPKGDLILLMDAHLAGAGVGAMTLYFPIPLVPSQWYHIAYQSNGHQTITIVNDLVRIEPHGTPIGNDVIRRPKDFVLGGFGKIIEVPFKNKWFYDSFTGYIDEVRLSTVARYDVDKEGFTPRGKFKNDAKTVALWHFDEPGGTREFSDASGNARHLVGNGGAATGIPLAVEAPGKLTTTWGRLKQ